MARVRGIIDALIAGRVHGKPAERQTKDHKPFATCVLRVSLRDGGCVFVSVIAFEESAVRALLALSNGDSAALSGELTPQGVHRQARRSAPLAGPSGALRAHRVPRRAQAQGSSRQR